MRHDAITLPSAAKASAPVWGDWRTPPMRSTQRAGTSDQTSSTATTMSPIRIEPWVLTHPTQSNGRTRSQRGFARALVSTSNSSGNHTSEKSSPRSPTTTPVTPTASSSTMATTRPPRAPRARA